MKRLFFLIIFTTLTITTFNAAAQNSPERPPINQNTVDQVTPLAQFGRGLVFNVAWLNYSNRIVVHNITGTYLYDGATFEYLGFLPGETQWAAASPYGSLYLGVERWNVHLWDIYKGQKLFVYDHGDLATDENPLYELVNRVAYFPDNEYLLVGGDAGWVRVWDLQTDQPVYTIENLGDLHGLAWSPDGSRFAVMADNEENQEIITIFAPDTGDELARYNTSVAYQVDLLWSPDGRYLTIIGGEPVTLWNPETGEAAQTLDDLGDFVFQARWSPDSTELALGYSDGRLVIWDIEHDEILKQINYHTDSVFAIDWSPDGRYLLSSGSDETLVIWDATTWDVVTTLDHPVVDDGVLGGDILAAVGTDGSVNLWDIHGGQPRQQILERSERIISLAISPDGMWLVVGGRGITSEESDLVEHYIVNLATGE